MPHVARRDSNTGQGRPFVASPPDVLAVRVASVVRVVIALGVGAAGSFVAPVSSDSKNLFLVAGFIWLPVASMVFLASDGDRHWPVVLGPCADGLMLLALEGLAPSTGEAALLGLAGVTALVAYTAGRQLAIVFLAGATLLSLVVQEAVPADERLAPAALLLFTITGVALVILLDRAAIIRARMASRSARIASRSDAILARVADAVVVTDVSGRIVEFNPAAERLVGASHAEVTGQSCADILGLRIGERVLDCSQGCRLAEFGTGPIGHEVWRLNGRRRQPLLANVDTVEQDGVPHEIVHSLRDITRLKQADEAKTMFLATASHELKTPLTVMMGFADLLVRDRDVTPLQREAAEAIHRRSQQLARIVDRLLLSSRIEAGRVDLHLEELALAPIVADRAGALGVATGRRVEVEIAADASTCVGDEHALVTVVDHLLDNAIKYSDARSTITVKVAAADDAELLSVTDTGVGMAAEEAARCFEKFWQAEEGDVRRYGGTGIGLYIVRSLVEAMRGSVAVESTPGTGSTFTVRLQRPERSVAEAEGDAGLGERSSIREFMRQIGVPTQETAG